VESFFLMDMERQGNNLFQTPNILSTVFLVRICDTLYLWSGESVGPLEVSSSMVDKDSHYHREACLGCRHAQTAHTNDCSQIFLSRARCPATVQQCFVFLDLGRKLLGHSLRKNPSDF
jgi:hypothetical protein